jgi:hypothetical protein
MSLKKMRVSVREDGTAVHWLKWELNLPACGGCLDRETVVPRYRVARSVKLTCPTCRDFLANWWEGYSAWWDGLILTDNPHPTGSYERVFWCEGWWYAKHKDGEGAINTPAAGVQD